jgi:hypothetical protein
MGKLSEEASLQRSSSKGITFYPLLLNNNLILA